MHDLVIKGGTVVDGTGGATRTADVAISGGIITEVGQVDGPATRTIDTFMLNLRKYFEGDPSRPVHFLSVRGMGYRFVGRNRSGEPRSGAPKGDTEAG